MSKCWTLWMVSFLVLFTVGCAGRQLNLNPAPGSRTPYHMLIVDKLTNPRQAQGLAQLLEDKEERAIVLLDLAHFENPEILIPLKGKVDFFLRSDVNHKVTQAEWDVLGTWVVGQGICIKGVWMFRGSVPPNFEGNCATCGSTPIVVNEVAANTFKVMVEMDRLPAAPKRVILPVFDAGDTTSVFSMKEIEVPQGGGDATAGVIHIFGLRFESLHKGHARMLDEWFAERRKEDSMFLPARHFIDLPWKKKTQASQLAEITE